MQWPPSAVRSHAGAASPDSRARATAPPAVARAVAVRHAAPRLTCAAVRRAVIHDPCRSLLVPPRSESCSPKASSRRLSSPRSRACRSSPRWSRSPVPKPPPHSRRQGNKKEEKNKGNVKRKKEIDYVFLEIVICKLYYPFYY
jgi:hypothetical protein